MPKTGRILPSSRKSSSSSASAACPAAAAIRSATLIGARSIAAEADMGTVEAGKLANFVVLDGDPEADIAALRGVLCSVKRGLRHIPEGRTC